VIEILSSQGTAIITIMSTTLKAVRKRILQHGGSIKYESILKLRYKNQTHYNRCNKAKSFVPTIIQLIVI
jgi:hypothetical protein